MVSVVWASATEAGRGEKFNKHVPTNKNATQDRPTATRSHLTASDATSEALFRFCSTVCLVFVRTSCATTAVSFFTTDENSAAGHKKTQNIERMKERREIFQLSSLQVNAAGLPPSCFPCQGTTCGAASHEKSCSVFRTRQTCTADSTISVKRHACTRKGSPMTYRCRVCTLLPAPCPSP